MSDVSKELQEIKSLLYGLRLDLNHLAQAQGTPVISHQNHNMVEKQRTVIKQAVRIALEKAIAN